MHGAPFVDAACCSDGGPAAFPCLPVCFLCGLYAWRSTSIIVQWFNLFLTLFLLFHMFVCYVKGFFLFFFLFFPLEMLPLPHFTVIKKCCGSLIYFGVSITSSGLSVLVLYSSRRLHPKLSLKCSGS